MDNTVNLSFDRIPWYGMIAISLSLPVHIHTPEMYVSGRELKRGAGFPNIKGNVCRRINRLWYKFRLEIRLILRIRAVMFYSDLLVAAYLLFRLEAYCVLRKRIPWCLQYLVIQKPLSVLLTWTRSTAGFFKWLLLYIHCWVLSVKTQSVLTYFIY